MYVVWPDNELLDFASLLGLELIRRSYKHKLSLDSVVVLALKSLF